MFQKRMKASQPRNQPWMAFSWKMFNAFSMSMIRMALSKAWTGCWPLSTRAEPNRFRV